MDAEESHYSSRSSYAETEEESAPSPEEGVDAASATSEERVSVAGGEECTLADAVLAGAAGDVDAPYC